MATMGPYDFEDGVPTGVSLVADTGCTAEIQTDVYWDGAAAVKLSTVAAGFARIQLGVLGCELGYLNFAEVHADFRIQFHTEDSGVVELFTVWGPGEAAELQLVLADGVVNAYDANGALIARVPTSATELAQDMWHYVKVDVTATTLLVQLDDTVEFSATDQALMTGACASVHVGSSGGMVTGTVDVYVDYLTVSDEGDEEVAQTLTTTTTFVGTPTIEDFQKIGNLLATHSSELAQELSSTYKDLLCPTCLGHKKVNAIVDQTAGTEIDCPTCTGTGWKDGVSPLVES